MRLTAAEKVEVIPIPRVERRAVDPELRQRMGEAIRKHVELAVGIRVAAEVEEDLVRGTRNGTLQRVQDRVGEVDFGMGQLTAHL